MMSSSCETNLANGWSENPLDLSVKRPEMDSHFHSRGLPSPWPNHTDIVVTRQQNVYDISAGTINSCAPPTVECSTNHSSYYPNVQSLHSDYYDNSILYREREMYSNMSQSSGHISHAGPSSHMLHQPLSSSSLPGQCLSYNRCLLPKKRKHLWQPCDGEVVIGASSEQYKNGDSSSDSVSSLSSDVEYKNGTASETVLKKRKCHWQSEGVIVASVAQGNVIQSNLDTVNTDILTRGNEGIKSGFTSVLAHAHFPETSEKLISEMKKSDIFGWTLKPMQPDLVTNATVDDNNDDDDGDDDEYINQNGNKKYFELQSFKKHNASDSVIGSTLLENHLKLEINHEVHPNDQMLQSVKLDDSNMSDSDGRIKLKESNVINVDSKRISSRRYDNVSENFDEAQNKLQSKDAKKGLSINDLLEDIETESLKNGNAEIDSSDRTKRNVIKLLQQCNHVKLQALDYLMSNVLIDDLHKASTNRNQTIQKILNGDKIKTVNMLDIVELQVEIGLR